MRYTKAKVIKLAEELGARLHWGGNPRQCNFEVVAESPGHIWASGGESVIRESQAMHGGHPPVGDIWHRIGQRMAEGFTTTRGGARPGAGRPATGKNPRIHMTVTPAVAEAVAADPDGAKAALALWAGNKSPSLDTTAATGKH